MQPDQRADDDRVPPAAARSSAWPPPRLTRRLFSMLSASESCCRASLRSARRRRRAPARTAVSCSRSPAQDPLARARPAARLGALLLGEGRRDVAARQSRSARPVGGDALVEDRDLVVDVPADGRDDALRPNASAASSASVLRLSCTVSSISGALRPRPALVPTAVIACATDVAAELGHRDAGLLRDLEDRRLVADQRRDGARVRRQADHLRAARERLAHVEERLRVVDLAAAGGDEDADDGAEDEAAEDEPPARDSCGRGATGGRPRAPRPDRRRVPCSSVGDPSSSPFPVVAKPFHEPRRRRPARDRGSPCETSARVRRTSPAAALTRSTVELPAGDALGQRDRLGHRRLVPAADVVGRARDAAIHRRDRRRRPRRPTYVKLRAALPSPKSRNGDRRRERLEERRERHVGPLPRAVDREVAQADGLEPHRAAERVREVLARRASRRRTARSAGASRPRASGTPRRRRRPRRTRRTRRGRPREPPPRRRADGRQQVPPRVELEVRSEAARTPGWPARWNTPVSPVEKCVEVEVEEVRARSTRYARRSRACAPGRSSR